MPHAASRAKPAVTQTGTSTHRERGPFQDTLLTSSAPSSFEQSLDRFLLPPRAFDQNPETVLAECAIVPPGRPKLRQPSEKNPGEGPGRDASQDHSLETDYHPRYPRQNGLPSRDEAVGKMGIDGSADEARCTEKRTEEHAPPHGARRFVEDFLHFGQGNGREDGPDRAGFPFQSAQGRDQFFSMGEYGQEGRIRRHLQPPWADPPHQPLP